MGSCLFGKKNFLATFTSLAACFLQFSLNDSLNKLKFIYDITLTYYPLTKGRVLILGLCSTLAFPLGVLA